MHTLAEVAQYLGLTFSGDAELEITGLASLASAGPNDLTFLRGTKSVDALQTTRAGAVLLLPELRQHCSANCLFSDDPDLSFALATALYDDAPLAQAGLHATAIIDERADVHPSATIGPAAVIEADVRIAEDAVIGAGVYLGHGSAVGAGTRLHPQVVVYHGVCIGRDCVVHAQAVLGADGFGFTRANQGWQKVHQLGGLHIGDRVEIGASTTIDRGALDDTVIGDGVIIDNQVQIGHNCQVGANSALAGCVGVAGSAVIGANCTLAGGVGVVGHVEICDDVHVTAMTMVTRSISEPGSYSSGIPMAPTADWKRNAARFSQLDKMYRRLPAEPPASADGDT